MYRIAILFLLGSAASGQGLDKTPPLVFTHSADGVEAKLQFHAQRNILNFQFPPMSATAGKRLELLRPLIERLFREQGRRKQYVFTFGRYDELNSRMAAAAVCSGAWRAGQGGPFIRDLLNQRHLYPELERFFQELGYTVTVKGAESIMLCPWNSIQPPPEMGSCKAKPKPSTQAPCGALITFELIARK